jgi:hypothetical protein
LVLAGLEICREQNPPHRRATDRQAARDLGLTDVLRSELAHLGREQRRRARAAELPPFGPTLDPDAHQRPDALRRNIAEAVRLLAAAKLGGGG